MIRVRAVVCNIAEVVGGDDALRGRGVGACDELSGIELEGMR